MTRSFGGFVMRVSLASACVMSVLGCSPGNPGHPPAARVVITPGYVPLGDAYHTDVRLDGTTSDDGVDDPKHLQPLLYQWEIEDADAPIDPSPEAPRITVRIAGTHPVTVRLTVADGDNVKSTVAQQIGVTVP